MNTPQVAASDWSVAQRIAFRFFFCYLVLYLSLNRLPDVLRPILDSGLYTAYAKTWYPIVPWVGSHILHLKTAVDPGELIMDGVGDTGFEYVQVFCFLMLAVLATLLWTLMDRRRKHYRELHYWLRVYARYVLAIVLLGYGMLKVVKTQFPFPGLSQLLTTYGDSSPFDLLWNFMGYSTSYTFFAGATELLGALLLFFRRTTTLGALVASATMLNVMMLNFSYDVTVKLGSMHLLLIAIFLAAPDLGRLTNVLVLNRPAAPVAPGPTFSSSWMRVGAVGAKILVLIFAVYSSTSLSLTLHRMNEQAGRIPIYGIYEVEEFSRNGQLLPPLTTDAVRWRRVLFGSRGTLSPMSIVMMDDSLQTYYSAKYDSEKHTITIFTENGQKKNVLTYSRPDVNHLVVEGAFKEDSVQVKLKKFDESKLPLVSARFHWLNDQI